MCAFPRTTRRDGGGARHLRGRPPYLFVKCWSMDYGRLTGAVSIKYDVRDTGWKLTREHVSYAPEEPNKDLLVWEEKKKRGIATVAVNTVKTLQFVGRIGKKLDGKLGAANVPGGAPFIKPASDNPLLKAAEEAKAKAAAAGAAPAPRTGTARRSQHRHWHRQRRSRCRSLTKRRRIIGH